MRLLPPLSITGLVYGQMLIYAAYLSALVLGLAKYLLTLETEWVRWFERQLNNSVVCKNDKFTFK